MTDILHRNKSFTNALHIDFAPMVKGIRVVISLMIRGLAATGDAAMRSSSAISRAFAMAYVDPYQTGGATPSPSSHEDLEGRDPSW